MKDIKVICDCGKEMSKIEDGREDSTLNHQCNYPEYCMEFACPCGQAVDLTWREETMTTLSS